MFSAYSSMAPDAVRPSAASSGSEALSAGTTLPPSSLSVDESWPASGPSLAVTAALNSFSLDDGAAGLQRHVADAGRGVRPTGHRGRREPRVAQLRPHLLEREVQLARRHLRDHG